MPEHYIEEMHGLMNQAQQRFSKTASDFERQLAEFEQALPDLLPEQPDQEES